jgi:secreted trypsin-like serine protease
MIRTQISLAYQRNGRVYKFCGGSLITWNKILTAAHCVTESKSTKYKFEENVIPP